jgi:ATP-dependent Clp protease ATP-binding subunit ClpA
MVERRSHVTFDPQATQAIETAKSALEDGAELDATTLVAALCHCAAVRALAPSLAETLGLAPPAPRREPGERVRMGSAVAAVVKRLSRMDGDAGAVPVSAVALLRSLLENGAGRADLAGAGLLEPLLDRALALLPSAPLDGEARRLLSLYGRLLDQPRPPCPSLLPVEPALRQLIETLVQRKHKSAIVVGATGTGKTRLVHELARRIATREASVPAELANRCVFALEPRLLRLGADRVGDLEGRVRSLVETIVDNPRVVLFVDDLHGLFGHERAPALDLLWTEVAAGRIAFLGCATRAEYRQLVAGNDALAQCLPAIQLPAPTREETVRILAARRGALEAYYGVTIAPALLERVVALAEAWLPAGHQPRTAIDLLELAAGARRADTAGPRVLDEAAVTAMIERKIGGSVTHASRLTADQVFQALSGSLVGQDETLRELAEAFVGGLGPFRSGGGPRGVYLLAGPTGVGKTRAALELARLLGGGRDCLLRIDANVLGGSGFDHGPATAELFGPPKGYEGHQPGGGGILARVREVPEAVVLFDEIEKAPPGVADLLLQMLGDGVAHDADGEVLDFRRSFILFTTNAAGAPEGPPIGPTPDRDGPPRPPTPRAVRVALRRLGFGDELLGRIHHIFVFQPLDRPALRKVFALWLEDMRRQLRGRGLALEIPEAVADMLVAGFPAQYGARPVAHELGRQLLEQVNLAASENQLARIHCVRVALAPAGSKRGRRVEGDKLIVEVAPSEEN